MFRLNLWSTRALFVRTAAGAIGIRLSLRPLFCKEGEAAANLGRIAPREHERISKDRHCERSEAIHPFFLLLDGLLRCARNDDRAV